jgi:histidinol-phosphate aminotransferase
VKLTRRNLAFLASAASPALFSQHAAVTGVAPPGTVWLNANENPDGPPPAFRDSVARAAAEASRYNHRIFPGVVESVAKFHGLKPDQVMLGAGSTEVLHCAVAAFTSSTKPLITVWPTWEMTRDVVEALGRPVVKVPLTAAWSADVERMQQAAKKAGGGVIHLGNPNNPTSSITAKKDLRWLAANLPANTVLLVDEAYAEFADSAEFESAIPYLGEGRPVVVTRTFSKIYGMAGVRAGYGCGPAELLKPMQPFRNNVISTFAARGITAALESGGAYVAAQRAKRIAIRAGVCEWLDRKGFRYVPPHANFVLADIRRSVAETIPRMLERGVAVGRRFDTLDTWMRFAIGNQPEMDKFQAAFEQVVARSA